jgi:primary-amine oxidase
LIKMADRLKQIHQHLSEATALPHPLDPLSSVEIEYVIALVRREHGQLGYNAVTLSEPKKKEMLAWLANTSLPRPRRMAEVIAVDKDSAVYDGVVDLKDGKIVAWEKLTGVQPLVSHVQHPLSLGSNEENRSRWRIFRTRRSW